MTEKRQQWSIDPEGTLLALSAIGVGTIIGICVVNLPQIVSMLGGGVKSACEQWKNDIKEYADTNPAVTGNYLSLIHI